MCGKTGVARLIPRGKRGQPKGNDSRTTECRSNSKFSRDSLPFGLTSAPHCFTKIMKPVVAHFRREGIFCVIYFDDLMI
nr:unnamed protein product [Callosobruchus chinensis]